MDRDEALRRQFVREARIGIGLIGLFGAIFLGVAISKFRDRYFSDDLEKIVSDKPPVLVAESPHSALQAATTSVIDQVAPRPGDTSATRPPPMPAPKSFPNTGEVPENPAERSTPTSRLDNPSQEPTTVTRQDAALEALEDKSLAANAQSLDPIRKQLVRLFGHRSESTGGNRRVASGLRPQRKIRFGSSDRTDSRGFRFANRSNQIGGGTACSTNAAVD
jgi:hypothetical protein